MGLRLTRASPGPREMLDWRTDYGLPIRMPSVVSFFKVDCSSDGGNPPRTLSQSSAILVKVGYSSLLLVKVDCSRLQIRGKDGRLGAHPRRGLA
jgi:hypothetical protein